MLVATDTVTLKIMTTGGTMSGIKNLIPVSKWNQYHDFPTVAALRNLIFFADRNGINKCIRKIGGRLYIEETAFFEWVEERSQAELGM